MLGRDEFQELTEAIVYINLLVAILAMVALYSQRRLTDIDTNEQQEWQQEIEGQLADIVERIKRIEDFLNIGA